MKQNTKAAEAENPPWWSNQNSIRSAVITCSVSRLTLSSLFLLFSLPYLIYYLQFPYCNLKSPDSISAISHRQILIENHTSALPPPPPPAAAAKTSLRHVVFGIAASSGLWERRKEYIKLWYRPDQMRGVVWIDKAPPLPEGGGGSNSESHLQNIMFSYAMAYGGGGFAISYPLAEALSEMQDRCLGRYPGLYGSDDRIQACMAEIGVPLTKEPGFHQFDVYGNAFGLLTAHPVTPLVSLHHIDVMEPIFPKATRLQSIQKLSLPISLDAPALMQQSICYDHKRRWTVSVSWGYAVQIIRGMISPREMEMPVLTFVNWHKMADHRGYSFNTRPVPRDQCRVPFVYTLSNAVDDPVSGKTVSEYVRHRMDVHKCKWRRFADPGEIDRVEVYKKPDPDFWAKAPRRNCCRVMAASSKKKKTMMIDVGECRQDEVMEMR
ncbi:hypothetical protein LINPERHAP1_LOCUS20045 [Linum perenne]